MNTNFAIKIVDVQTHDDTEVSHYFFHLFTKTSIGVLVPTTTDDEPLCLCERDFHDLTNLLSADVYSDDKKVLENGLPANGQFPPQDVMHWVRGVRGKGAGDFLLFLASAALQADDDNLARMLPLLRQMMQKYPEYAMDRWYNSVPER